MDRNIVMKMIEEKFGSIFGFLGYQILMLSATGQPCDITFYKKPPAINIKIDQRICLAIMYGAHAKKLSEMLEYIRLSNGDVISIGEIWTINSVPEGSFSEKDLKAVDLSKAEEKIGPNGETLRKMISDTYHCKTRKEEDYYLHRFIAS